LATGILFYAHLLGLIFLTKKLKICNSKEEVVTIMTAAITGKMILIPRHIHAADMMINTRKIMMTRMTMTGRIIMMRMNRIMEAALNGRARATVIIMKKTIMMTTKAIMAAGKVPMAVTGRTVVVSRAEEMEVAIADLRVWIHVSNAE
jgi:hypothetical protein